MGTAFVASSFFGTSALKCKTSLSTSAASSKPARLRMVTPASGRSKVFDAFTKSSAPWNTAGFGFSLRRGPETVVARTVVQPVTTCIADDYIAQSARRQYIAVGANGGGVYSVECTEGASKFAAEDSRIAALAANFRRRQLPTLLSFADLYETRRRATMIANGCSYEESLVKRFAAAAEATIVGTSEKLGACARYADPTSVEENYMSKCVDRASSSRATSGGVYGVMCCDGTVKEAAESKRVRGLSTTFRNKQVGPLMATQRKFNQSKFAYSQFAGMCSYEEGLFSKYPATAARMRPDYARY